MSTFTGTAFRWISRTGATSGIANVHLDGKLLTEVDRYSSSNRYQAPVLTRTGLPDQVHTVKIACTGEKNPAATDANPIIDAFELGRETSSTEPSPSPTPTATATPTANATPTATPRPTTTPTAPPHSDSHGRLRTQRHRPAPRRGQPREARLLRRLAHHDRR